MPTVDFARTMVVPADRDAVWSVLTDVATVAGWISIVSGVEEIAPLAEYSAILSDRMGPFKLQAGLSVRVVELQPPVRVGFHAEGEDHQVGSRIRVEAGVALEASDLSTMVEVNGTYEVTGRVATLGASMIRTKGDKILDEFFAALGQAWQ
jgi:carbon monoxide dehydrogenase subunit G